MNEHRIPSAWQIKVAMAHALSTRMAAGCSARGKALIIEETRKFTGQSAPAGLKELQARQTQLTALNSRISRIAFEHDRSPSEA